MNISKKNITGFFVFIGIILNTLCLNAQETKRFSPEVLSTTVLIDQDTDFENLREQLERVYKNTSIKEIREIRAWQELSYVIRDVLQNNNMKYLFDDSTLTITVGSETFNLAKENSTLKGFIIWYFDIFKDTIENKINDLEIDEELKTEIKKKTKNFIISIDALIEENDLIKDNLELKTKDVFDFIIRAVDLTNDEINDKVLSKLMNLILILGKFSDDSTVVEESKRIIAIAEIGKEIHKIIQDLKVDSDKFSLIYDSETIIISFKDSLTLSALLYDFLINIKKSLRSNLVIRLGSNHEIVEMFDVYYNNILTGIEYLEKKYPQILDKEIINKNLRNDINEFISIYNSLKKASEENNLKEIKKTIAETSFKTDLGKALKREYLNALEELHKEVKNLGNDTENTSSLNKMIEEFLYSHKVYQEFVKKQIINQIENIIVTMLIPELTKASESTGRFEFLSNIGFSKHPEIGNILLFNFSNRPDMRFEFFTNLFLNEEVGLSTENIAVGLSGKSQLGDKTELGVYLSFIIKELTKSEKEDLVKFGRKGIYFAFNYKSVIPRIFYEYDYPNKPDTFHNYGLEIKFPNWPFLSSLFGSITAGESIKPKYTFGITLPSIK